MFKRNRPINKISKKKKVKVNDKSQGLNKVKHDSPKVLEDVILKRYIKIRKIFLKNYFRYKVSKNKSDIDNK